MDAIEIIYDQDHGTENEGWYVRYTSDGGQRVDDIITTAWEHDPDVAETTIRNWAIGYFCPLDGTTEEYLAEINDAITITR